MTEFVTCAACGARIKADRQRCLRCGETLLTTSDRAVVAPPALSSRQWTLTLAGGAVALLAVGLLLWVMRPAIPGPDEEVAVAYGGARPGPGANRPAREPRSEPAPVVVPAAAAFVDSTRRANAAF